MRNQNNNFVERRDRTKGGYIITQIDSGVFNRMGRPIMFFIPRTQVQRPSFTPQEAEKFYLDMIYHSEHPTRWKLKQIIRTTKEFWKSK